MSGTGMNLWEEAEELASNVLDCFSELHPHIRLNRQEWADLREMIEREVVSYFSEDQPRIGAHDLLRKPEEAH
jgi:hypothetical protein